MYLKRHYRMDAPEETWPAEGQPPLDYVEVIHTGWTPAQHFSTHFVRCGLEEDWIKLEGQTLKLHTEPVPLTYTIIRTPGRYCCHCGEKLTDDLTGDMARIHVMQRHARVVSPDPENPAGYRLLNYYDCELSADDHAVWGLTRGEDGHLYRGGKVFKGGYPIG